MIWEESRDSSVGQLSGLWTILPFVVVEKTKPSWVTARGVSCLKVSASRGRVDEMACVAFFL